MTPQQLVTLIRQQPENISFNDVMACINEHYQYTPSRFTNGCDNNVVINEAGQNEGSCKLFAFAQLHELNQDETLACFGDYYRVDVLQNPTGSDHGNIRSFMRCGWEGINFEQAPLTKR